MLWKLILVRPKFSEDYFVFILWYILNTVHVQWQGKRLAWNKSIFVISNIVDPIYLFQMYDLYNNFRTIGLDNTFWFVFIFWPGEAPKPGNQKNFTQQDNTQL